MSSLKLIRQYGMRKPWIFAADNTCVYVKSTICDLICNKTAEILTTLFLVAANF